MSDQCKYFAETVEKSPDSYSDFQSPVELSIFEQIRDAISEYKTLQGLQGLTSTEYERSFLKFCSDRPPPLSQTGCAIVAITSNPSVSSSKLREGFNHVGYDSCILDNPSTSTFLEAVLTLVRSVALGHVHTPVLIGFSGLGTKDALCFSDGELKMALILKLLQCIPSETPVVLLLEYVDSNGSEGQDKPYPFCHQNHLYYNTKRSIDDFPQHSFFHYFSDQLLDPTPTTFKSIIHTFDDRLNNQSAVFTATRKFQDVSPLAVRQCQSGMPDCDCGSCSIYTICSSECQNPNHTKRIPILCHNMPALLPLQNISTSQMHVLTLSIGYALQLLKRYCQLLSEADPDELKFFLRSYYPGFRVMAADLNLVEEFQAHVVNTIPWVTHSDLKRLRDLAKALKVEEAVKVVDTLESTLDRLINERIIQTTETVHYAYDGGCTCKPHFLFVVDNDFQKLPQSMFAALYTRVLDGIKKSKGVDPYVSFVTIQNAALHGFNVKSLSQN